MATHLQSKGCGAFSLLPSHSRSFFVWRFYGTPLPQVSQVLTFFFPFPIAAPQHRAHSRWLGQPPSGLPSRRPRILLHAPPQGPPPQSALNPSGELGQPPQILLSRAAPPSAVTLPCGTMDRHVCSVYLVHHGLRSSAWTRWSRSRRWGTRAWARGPATRAPRSRRGYTAARTARSCAPAATR